MDETTLLKELSQIGLQTTDESITNWSDLKTKKVVLYFYPRDNTPGCTQESNDFKDLYSQFRKANIEIIGVSRDSLKSHEKFKQKFDLPFTLISDEDENLCKLLDVIKPKNMFGKKVKGIERSTFLFDKDGKLRQQWRKVKVKGHAQEVLESAKAL